MFLPISVRSLTAAWSTALTGSNVSFHRIAYIFAKRNRYSTKYHFRQLYLYPPGQPSAASSSQLRAFETLSILLRESWCAHVRSHVLNSVSLNLKWTDKFLIKGEDTLLKDAASLLLCTIGHIYQMYCRKMLQTLTAVGSYPARLKRIL